MVVYIVLYYYRIVRHVSGGTFVASVSSVLTIESFSYILNAAYITSLDIYHIVYWQLDWPCMGKVLLLLLVTAMFASIYLLVHSASCYMVGIISSWILYWCCWMLKCPLDWQSWHFLLMSYSVKACFLVKGNMS